MKNDRTEIGCREPGTANREHVDLAAAAGCAREPGGSRRGQTTTDYLMIAGIMTAIGILVLLWMFEPWRAKVEEVADCVRTDDCDAVGAQ